MSVIPELFLTFAKIGLFTFGGGYAMIALIEDACVDRKKWITQEEMMDITVIAESTPGPIAINCATFTGYKTGGFWGAVAATVGVTLPSLVIVFLISMFLDNFLELTVIANAFKGIKIAVGILILQAGFKLRKTVERKPLPTMLLVGCLRFGAGGFVIGAFDLGLHLSQNFRHQGRQLFLIHGFILPSFRPRWLPPPHPPGLPCRILPRKCR